MPDPYFATLTCRFRKPITGHVTEYLDSYVVQRATPEGVVQIREIPRHAVLAVERLTPEQIAALPTGRGAITGKPIPLGQTERVVRLSDFDDAE